MRHEQQSHIVTVTKEVTLDVDTHCCACCTCGSCEGVDCTDCAGDCLDVRDATALEAAVDAIVALLGGGEAEDARRFVIRHRPYEVLPL